MIRLIEQDDDFYCNGKDPFAVRCGGLFAAYGAGVPFAMFWKQIDKSGKTCAVISLFDNSMTIAVYDYVNSAELAEFIAVMGADIVFCSEQTASFLKLRIARRVAILSRPLVNHKVNPILSAPDYRKAYEILSSGGDIISLPIYEIFYADICHRVRHNAGRIAFAPCGESAAGVAVSAFETEDSAIISGVAVLPEYRGSGVGRKVMERLFSSYDLIKKQVFVFAEDSAIGFYEKLGFEACGTAVYCNKK